MSLLHPAIPAVAALGLGGTAFAQTMGTPVSPAGIDAPSTFSQLDTNHDGSISPAEAAANTQLSNEFVSLDTNGDGALEPAEFARFEAMGAATTHGVPGEPGMPRNTSPVLGTPPPMTSTPPPLGSTPPPNGSTPPPMGSSPPPGRR